MKKRGSRMIRRKCCGTALLACLLMTGLQAQEKVDELMEGFDDTPAMEQTEQNNDLLSEVDEGDLVDPQENDTIRTRYPSKRILPEGLSGYIKQQAVYSYAGATPHQGFSSLRATLFVDYEHKFSNGWKFKSNVRSFHDWVYDTRTLPYTSAEKKALRSEVELFDVYLEGSLSDKLDFRIGRQVVVWGRSDTIRITDVLNPIDNRQPGMVDIKDLRLPVAMAKLDYYIGKWRITPIVILEQRFTKDPPYGSQFYPLATPLPPESDADKITYALSVGGEFSGWDVNFYAAHIYDDSKFVQDPMGINALIKHHTVTMYGVALNYLSGSWLIKTEAAYFDALHYTMAPERRLSRLDMLAGVECNGIADTMISYDVSVRHFTAYDRRLSLESVPLPGGGTLSLLPVARDTWQHALRISSDFMNDTLHTNYLISLFGKRVDEGGFQRAWIEYDVTDDWKLSAGAVDYIGGSKLFDHFKDDDLLFADMTYSF